MPELPDLQVFSRNLNSQLAGKAVADVALLKKTKIKTTAAALKKALKGKTVEKVYRSGKELRFELTGKTILGMHLMLHGKLRWFQGKKPPAHTLLALYFDNTCGLALTDYQGIATVSLNPQEPDSPDALSKELNARYLGTLFSTKKTAVKKLLLDQHLIRGIGNAYADEILWEAGISPFSVSNKIPAAYIKKLVRSIRKVLTNAEKKIRTSHPDIIAGEVRDFLKIHQAGKKESPTGTVVRQKLLNGRKTYYTDEQELFK